MAYRLVAHVQLVKHQRRILADVRVRAVEINSAVSAPIEGIGFAGTYLSIHNCSLAMHLLVISTTLGSRFSARSTVAMLERQLMAMEIRTGSLERSSSCRCRVHKSTTSVFLSNICLAAMYAERLYFKFFCFRGVYIICLGGVNDSQLLTYRSHNFNNFERGPAHVVTSHMQLHVLIGQLEIASIDTTTSIGRSIELSLLRSLRTYTSF